jgi:putative ABC transport system permease protein
VPSPSLVLRGLWWRRGFTAALLVVAVATTASAALGPLYARAAGESILQDHLRQAGSTAGLHVHADLNMSADQYASIANGVPRPGSVRGFGDPIAALYTFLGEGALVAGAQVNVTTALAWRAGACQHLFLVSGRCPSAPNEAIASQRTVDNSFYGFHLGSSVGIAPLATRGELPPRPPPAVRIVGVYRPIDTADPFWFGQPYFAARVGVSQQPDSIDALFVAKSEFLALDPSNVVEADFDYPVIPSAIRLSTVPAERAEVSHLLREFTDQTVITVNTAILGVLDAAAKERQLAQVGTLLVTLQLTLLAWLVLFQVMSDAIEARGNEIALAKLRGLPPFATTRFGLGEAIVALTLALPIGVAAALGITHLFASSVLIPAVPVVLTPAALGTAAIAFAGGLGAAVLAGYRTLTRSVLDQWRRTSRRHGPSRVGLAIDTVLAAAAATGLVLLREQHHSASSNGSVALLAPGMLVAAVGIIGVRLLPLLCRSLARATRASDKMAIFLATRQVARRPVGLRLAALLAVAVGLATFAVAGETVATGNRADRAQAELGASRVVSVQFDEGVDPVSATARADPGGHWAMAAATWLPDGGDSVTGTVLAVDSSRLRAVGYPVSGGRATSELATTIGTAPVPAITITAALVRVHLIAGNLAGDARPYLELNLRTPRNRFYNVDSHAITNGSATYVLPVHCSSGCTLLGLSWRRPFAAVDAESGTLKLTGIDIGTDDNSNTGEGADWTPLDLGSATAHSWRAANPEGQATDQLGLDPTGITDRFTNINGGYGGISYAFVPAPLPAVATRQAIVSGPTAPVHPALLDSAEVTATFHVVHFTKVLPQVLDNGVLMDVRYLMVELPGFTTEAQWQIWLGPHAPRDALARLSAAGLQVESVRTEHARLTQLNREGPALALLLLLVCAVVGTVLAVGGTAISINASSRRRSYEIAALRAIGVRRAALLRASVVEQMLLLSPAAVLGIPTGWLAARLAMPVIPEFADSTPISLRYTPGLAPTLLFAGTFVLLLALTAALAARLLIRLAIPSRLREAEG